MERYLLMVAILRFSVSFLLLLGAARICGHPSSIPRTSAAAFLSGLYAAVCLLPGFDFLGNKVWYVVFLVLMGLIAYGWEKTMIRTGAVFFLLNLALDGVVSDDRNVWAGLVGAAGLFILCIFGFRGGSGGLVPVQLTHEGKCVSIMALRDTGNTLTDPVTGKPILVVGADVANKLTGLTADQLCKPVESISLIPGLRLVPYSTVGQSGALMLAMRLQEVRIGSWKGSGLVAFAPKGLSSKGAYQALTGGTV